MTDGVQDFTTKKSLPSHPEIVSKHFRKIAYLETSKAYGFKRAARPLNDLWALPVYSAVE